MFACSPITVTKQYVHVQVGNKDVLNCYYAHAEDSLQVCMPQGSIESCKRTRLLPASQAPCMHCAQEIVLAMASSSSQPIWMTVMYF